MPDELISITTPDGDLPAHLWRPSSGTGPGILLQQEIFGVSDYVARRGQDLADLGYVVLAPELYWRRDASRVENGPEALEQALALVQRLDWASAVEDGVAALEALGKLPGASGGAGIVGFCFGGGLGFNVAAVADPDVLVSYYGSALPSLLALAPEVTAPSLHHFGLADSYIDAATVAQVEQAVAGRPDVTFATYPGADHAFDNDDFMFFDAEASARAWQGTVEFLAERLPTG